MPTATNLPRHLTSFVGREREITQAKRLLGRSRLLTFTGPGGIGKTRLAIEVAQRLLAEFRDGAFFVSLDSVADPKLVVPTIAQALNVSEVPGQALVETLVSSLSDKQVLLILDNFEHVLPAALEVAQLAATCTLLQVIVTSRQILRLQGEHELQVPPLDLPPAGAVREQTVQPEHLARYEAVRLFAERAVGWSPDFVVNNSNAPAVAEICYRLDGLPLAIELAAARIKLLSPQAMLKRLGSRLSLLTVGSRDLPARHRTLRGVIDWSYNLLDEHEQRLFQRLSVFAGGCTLEAVEAVCGLRFGTSNIEVTASNAIFANPYSHSAELLDALGSLVDKGLLKVVGPEETTKDGVQWLGQRHAGDNGKHGEVEPRFWMLQTLREYAAERLAESEEGQEVRRRHALFYLALAERADYTGAAQLEWLGRVEAEHDNLRAALYWSAGGDESTEGRREISDLEIALRLGAALTRFWLMQSHLLEGCQWLDRLVALSIGARKELRVPVLYGAALLNIPSGGDRQRSEALYRETLALSREVGNKRHTAWCLNDLGFLAIERGDLERGEALCEESLALKMELGDRRDIAITRANLAFVARVRGDYEQATARNEEAVALVRSLGDEADRYLLANMLNNSGHLALRNGDYQKAQTDFEESLTFMRGLGEWLIVTESLAGLGVLSQVAGDWGRAAHLLGAAEILLEEAGGSLMWAVDRAQLERTMASARAHLGEAAWGQARADVRALTIDDVIRLTLENVPFPLRPIADDTGQPLRSQLSRRDKPFPNDLTRREVDVLRSVAQGHSNPQVAEQLSLSRNTVEAHLRSIFSKINVSSRTAAARFAMEHGLA